MCDVADESSQGDERKVTNWPQKIFHVIAEHKQKIRVADEMDHSGVKKE